MTKNVNVPHGTRPPLSWRQRAFWVRMMCQESGNQTPRWWFMPFSTRISSSVPIAHIQAAISTMVARHESLRTKIATDSYGRPKQDLQSEVSIPLLISDESTYSYEAAKSRMFDMLRRPGFDLYTDLPIRAGIAKLSQEHSLLMIVIHHIAADGWSIFILKDELEGLLAVDQSRSQRIISPSSRKIELADIAREQNSTAGQQHETRALAYIQDCLLQCPQSLFPGQPEDTSEGSRWQRAHLTSPKLFSAVAVIARTYRVTAPSVLLGLYVAVLSSYTAQRQCCVNMLVSNRRRSGMQEVVACIANAVPVHFDLTHCSSLSDIIRLSFKKSVEAMRYGAYSLERFEVIRREVEYRRGIRFRRQPIFNYDVPPGVDSETGHAAGLVRKVYVEDVEPTQLASPLQFWAYKGARILVGADCRVLEDVKGFTVAIERLATHLASGSDPGLCDLAKIGGLESHGEHEKTLDLYENSWVNLREIERMIETHPAVRGATVRLSEVEGGQDQELVAHITPRSDISAAELRDYLFERLYEWPFAVVPTRYVGIREHLEIQRRQPKYLGLLVDVINHIHGCKVAKAHMSYLLAGADVEMIPSVIAELRRRGLVGLKFVDLFSEISLVELANRLQCD
jgi:condensation domain-containing protein